MFLSADRKRGEIRIRQSPRPITHGELRNEGRTDDVMERERVVRGIEPGGGTFVLSSYSKDAPQLLFILAEGVVE